MNKTCPECKTKFITNSKKKIFCSSKCMRIYHSEKSALKLIIDRREDNKECQICGQNEYPINVIHHVKQRNEFGSDDPNNLITVCPNCHAMIHKGILVFDFKERRNIK